MDIKEIAEQVSKRIYVEDGLLISKFISEKFSEALISAYKVELLNEVGEPVAYMTTDEEGSASMLFFDRAEALKYSGDDEPVNLFAESQLLSAVAKKDEEINHLRMALADTEALEAGTAETNQKLRDQLATAEQRVAEACALSDEDIKQIRLSMPAVCRHEDIIKATEIFYTGKYRKFMKEGE